MSTDTVRVATPQICEFGYENCRNITPSHQTKYKVLTGFAKASSFLKLPDDANVRAYLLDATGAKKQKPSNVHRAIRESLQTNIAEFPVLNGGIVIVASEAIIEDKKRMMVLKGDKDNPVSIINGSQTQGELRRFIKSEDFTPENEPLVRYEIIVTDDDDLRSEISISRNFQNQVAFLSIMGKREMFGPLEEAIQKTIPDARLMSSETDSKNDALLPTEHVLKVAFAMLPDEIFAFGSKTSTYGSKAKWLKELEKLVKNAEEPEAKQDQDALDCYSCLLDIAGPAWQLYEKWKADPDYKKGFKSTPRKKGGKASVEETPDGERKLSDGMVFPVLAALSVFVVKKENGCWEIDIPEQFAKLLKEQLIDAAKDTYRDSAGGNPQTMGKTLACYSAIARVPKMYQKMAAKM